MTSGAKFPRRMRLTGTSVFSGIFAQPIKSSDRYFTVLARRNGLAYPRLGLSMPRKIARSSVARHRLKRIVRESFRHQQTQLGSVDFVVLGRVGSAALDNAVLFAALQRHWQKLATQCAAC